MAQLIRRSVALDPGHAVVEVLAAAVPSIAVVVRLNIARRHQTTNHLEGAGPKQTGGARALDLVPSVTLDWLAVNLRHARCNQN